MSKHSIIINNFNNNETIIHSIILLKGRIISYDSCDKNEIIVEIDKFKNTVKLNENNFKCLIQLSNGINAIKISYCCMNAEFILNYCPALIDYYVIPIYIICENHDGLFQAPDTEDNSITSACLRINLGVKLIQSLFSEKLYDYDLERKTFQLESDLIPDVPECRVFYSKLDVDAARNMSQENLWATLGRELVHEFGNVKCKYLAFISCTRYRSDKYSTDIKTFDDIVSITEAHAALGGGGLAIFGSACLHTWPQTIQEVVTKFESVDKVDKYKYMDQSSYRGTYGGCYSTTLGAVCHELCHTFDLGHTFEGIMGQGFDRIDKEFMFDCNLNGINRLKRLNKEQHATVSFTQNAFSNKSMEPVLKLQFKSNKNKFKAKRDGIFWTRSCVMILYYHRWLNPDCAEHALEHDANIVKSSAGICVVELRNVDTGMVLKWWDFSGKPLPTFEIPQPKCLKLGACTLVVEDLVGNVLKKHIDDC